MSTRANIYIMDQLVGEEHSNAYPVPRDDPFYPDSLWGLLQKLDEERCTEAEFRCAIQMRIKDPDYLPPHATGVGNWSYEYCWYPVEPPIDYRDWENWRGRVLFREYDRELWEKLGHGYWTVPGPWKLISEWAPPTEEENNA